MLFTDLMELKALLQIDPGNSNEDKSLSLFAEMATSLMEEVANRDFSYKVRTTYYGGTGTQSMLTRHRPVYPIAGPDPYAAFTAISILQDDNGFFGSSSGSFQGSTSTTLVYGTDFCVDIDQDNGSSRSGILYRLNNYWRRPVVRQPGYLSPFVGQARGNYQVTYSAGHTVNTLPAHMRLGAVNLVAKMRNIVPTGMELGSESYEDRAVGYVTAQRDYLMSLVKPLFFTHRNWKW